MNNQVTTTADSYAVGFPAEWMPIPLDAEEHGAYVATTIEKLRAVGVATTDRRRVEMVLRQTRKQLVESDVRYAVLGLTVLDESEGLLIGAGSVIATSREALGSNQKLRVATMARALSIPQDTSSTEAPVDVDPPEIVDLPAGQAVWLRRYHRIVTDPGQSMELYAESYLVPHDDGESLCTLQFVTPNIEFALGFSKVFAGSARSLRILSEGDPTTFDLPADAAAGEVSTDG
jgi:hypothetical protein